MNTKTLSKLYDRLTARERLRLIMAAERRADAVERRRLVDAASSLRSEVSDHHGLATALAEAAHVHLLTLLGLAVSYWQWRGLWGWQGQGRLGTKDADPGGAAPAANGRAGDEKGFRLYGMVRYQAFLFVTHSDGWGQFCRDWHVEPEALLDFEPGWDMVTRTEARACEHAFGPEDAAMFLLSETPLSEGTAGEGRTLPELLRVQSLAEGWHAFIDRQVKSPPGQGRD